MPNPIRVLVLLSALLPILALEGCVAKYDVRTDSDPAIDFSAYKSFAIPPRPKPDTPDILDNSLVRKRLEGMFAKELTGHGLAPVADAAAADLLVRYWVTTEAKTDISTVPSAGPYGYGYGYGSPYPYWGGRWGPMYQDVIVRDYTEGTLVLDLVDRQRDELVWRAYVVGTLSRERETVYELVEEALGRAFEDYPPQPRKKGRR